ncbi:retrotransposon protein, putative, unclassified [Tanacetum coccineum]|uniref:Retrotransposon protein, putative, unclassified n=1 Tax=Tanacetum coccineum TaxID=301880 RepID=A0ABQ5CAY5_9ASTR
MAASPDLCLVGKMFADNRTFSRDVVSSIIKSAWRSRSLYLIYPWENNHFIFTFSEEQDAQRILHDSPWLVKGHCLILQPWNPNVHISEIDFSHEMFWVQAHGLPFGKLTRAYATELAPKVGALVDVDCDAEGSQLDNLVEVPVKVMSIDDTSDSNVGVVAAPDQPYAPCTRAFPNILACVESVVSNNTNFSLESPVTNYEIHKAVKELGALKAPEISKKKDESSSNKTEFAQDSSAKRAGDKIDSDESKKQKTDKNEEVKEDNEAELKKHLVIVKDDDIAIDAIPLATKPTVIVEYKLIREGIMAHYQLIKADGSSKRYSSMIKML